ncbi:hypothetical protein HMN09_00188800 [Mycena chlorophos]|uniref:Uncharacterized protein n=1 Tax=Mycena chlorophos TaxID=658473 RepID=A0A8H6WN95_MYCCL|nr:hypothetical protein HMN09_00188800 [Mycena chlorophos]
MAAPPLVVSSGIQRLQSILNAPIPPFAGQDQAIADTQARRRQRQAERNQNVNEPAHCQWITGNISVAEAPDTQLEQSFNDLQAAINRGYYPWNPYGDFSQVSLEPMRDIDDTVAEMDRSIARAPEHGCDCPTTAYTVATSGNRMVLEVLIVLLRALPKLGHWASAIHNLHLGGEVVDQQSHTSLFLSSVPKDRNTRQAMRVVENYQRGPKVGVTKDPVRERLLRKSRYFPTEIKSEGYLTYSGRELDKPVVLLTIETTDLGIVVPSDLTVLAQGGWYLNGNGRAPRPVVGARAPAALTPNQKELLNFVGKIAGHSKSYGVEFVVLTDTINHVLLQLPKKAKWYEDSSVETEIKWVVRREADPVRMWMLWALSQGAEYGAKMLRDYEGRLGRARFH